MRYGSSSRKAAWTPPAAFGKRFTRPSVRLDRFHVKGHRRSDLASRPLRFRRVRDYLIAYAPDEGTVAGRRGDARKPQSPRYGRDSEEQGINPRGAGGVGF